MTATPVSPIPPVTLTTQVVVEALDRAVEDYGTDWVDPNSGPDSACKYRYTDDKDVTRHCIVGWVLTDLLGEVWYADTYDDDAGVGAGNLLRALEERGLITVADSDAEELLVEAQRTQDKGSEWGEAVECAKGFIEERDL